MVEKLKEHLRKNAYGLLALFIAIGGTAYAVDGPNPGQNTIGSEDIIGNEVRSDDIGNGRIFNLDIADEIIQGGKIKNGTLTGDDIGDGSVPRSDVATIEGWHYIGGTGEPAFQNGWENYDTSGSPGAATWQHAAYAKDDLGNVYVRGLVADGTINQPIFTLPPAYCPYFYHPFPVASNSAFGEVLVEWVGADESGGCNVIPRAGSNTWLNLDGVTFQEHPIEDNGASAPAAVADRRAYLPPSGP